MKIPERLQILANRYGNKSMIDKILEKFPDGISDEYTLEYIFPDRQGIIILKKESDKPITLLTNEENYFKENETKSVEIREKKKKKYYGGK